MPRRSSRFPRKIESLGKVCDNKMLIKISDDFLTCAEPQLSDTSEVSSDPRADDALKVIENAARSAPSLQRREWLRGRRQKVSILPEKSAAMRQILRAMPPRDQQVLIRYYLQGQTDEQICNEMDLPLAELENIKSEVRLRFRTKVQSLMQGKKCGG